MAFFAELKRRQWYCINRFNAINWYSGKVRTDWWNSLTDEQKKEEIRKEQIKEEESRREIIGSLMGIAYAGAMLAGLGSRSRFDKYIGLYGLDGFVNPDYFENKKNQDVIDVEAVEL